MCKYKNSIQNWAKEDQPKYKLITKGKRALSDVELLCIIIGSGTCTDNSLEIARKLYAMVAGSLSDIAKLSIADLEKIPGIGHAKAATIVACFELGNRKTEYGNLLMDKITKSADAYEIFKSRIGDQPYEEFWIILLNKANRVIQKCSISEGGVSGTVVDPKKIFKYALDAHASSIICGHNHPSGNIQPSEADHKITRKIKDSGILLDIAVLDHIIVGRDSYYSFADDGMI